MTRPRILVGSLYAAKRASWWKACQSATVQTGGRSYATPTLREFVQMRRQSRRLHQEASKREGPLQDRGTLFGLGKDEATLVGTIRRRSA